MRFSKQVGLMAFSAVLAFASQSFAAQIEFNGHGASRRVDYFNDLPGPPVPGDIKLGEWAGEMNVEVDNQPLTAYCVDLLNDADNVWAATLIPVASWTNSNKMAIAYLYDTFALNIILDNDAAGLQVAIWELVVESQRDLDNNNFKYLGASFESNPGVIGPAVKARANFYLSQIPANVETTYVSSSLIVLDVTDPFRQTLIVPEPSSLSVLALGAMLVLRRRR